MRRIKEIIKLHYLIFIFAFLLNLLWEYLHEPLYITTMVHDLFGFLYMAAADGLLVLLIYWIVCLQARTFFWPSDWKKQLVLIIISGIFLSFFIEIKNMYFTSVWSYTAAMPVLPILHIGISPVLQMVITPVLVFALAGFGYKLAKNPDFKS